MSPCSETVSRRKPGRQEDSTRRPTLSVSLPSTSPLRSPITDMRQKNGTGNRSSPSSSRDAERKTVEVRRYRSALLEGRSTLYVGVCRKSKVVCGARLTRRRGLEDQREVSAGLQGVNIPSTSPRSVVDSSSHLSAGTLQLAPVGGRRSRSPPSLTDDLGADVLGWPSWWKYMYTSALPSPRPLHTL